MRERETMTLETRLSPDHSCNGITPSKPADGPLPFNRSFNKTDHQEPPHVHSDPPESKVSPKKSCNGTSHHESPHFCTKEKEDMKLPESPVSHEQSCDEANPHLSSDSPLERETHTISLAAPLSPDQSHRGSSNPCPLPDIISGDFDSVKPELLKLYDKLGVKIIPTPCQNETDFTKALAVMAQFIQDKNLPVSSLQGF